MQNFYKQLTLLLLKTNRMCQIKILVYCCAICYIKTRFDLRFINGLDKKVKTACAEECMVSGL